MSVKEQLWCLRKNDQLYVLRLFRRACKEAYERGANGVTLDYLPFDEGAEIVLPDKRAMHEALSEIINGPKKARGK